MGKKDMEIKKQSECVRVVIRVRPLSSTEVKDNREKIVNMDYDKGEVIVKRSNDNEPPKVFTFDSTYPEVVEQEKIFNETALPIIDNVLEGFNGTIFAYGQTGTGKTHTMCGILDD